MKDITTMRLSAGLVTEVRNYALIVLGMAIYAIGFTVFLLPHQIVIGGMAGFSTLVFYASRELLPIAAVMYGTNLLLLACGYRYLGHRFVIRTVFGATVLSLFIGMLEGYFVSHPPLVKDVTMSVLMGATLCGIGIGVYYSHHGTAGGTDIVAAIMSKVSNVSVGQVMMVVDMTIVACSFFLPFDGDMETRVQMRTESIIYGWMSIFLYSYITDLFLKADIQTVQFIIISDRWEEIGRRITTETGRGVTTWRGEGFWTHNERTVMLVWCRRVNCIPIMDIVRQVDPDAYITHSYVRSVYGNGFDTYRLSKRPK